MLNLVGLQGKLLTVGFLELWVIDSKTMKSRRQVASVHVQVALSVNVLKPLRIQVDCGHISQSVIEAHVINDLLPSLHLVDKVLRQVILISSNQLNHRLFNDLLLLNIFDETRVL